MPHPAASYAEALERVRVLQALDDATIRPNACTHVLDHGARAPLAVVLLHGLTNHPGQFARFAPQVHARGYNVIVPRMPEHGDVDRMTARLKNFKAEAALRAATEALDIACGLGERVCVLGISSGALVAAHFAQFRADVARAILVNPVFALVQLPHGASLLLEKMLSVIPNFFVWWDPRYRLKTLPSTAYPRFSTHALTQCLRIGDDVYARCTVAPMAAQSAVAVTNRTDPAVTNEATEEVVRAWRQFRPTRVGFYEFTNLPANHDVIDPENIVARTEIVYPKLLKFIDTTP